MLSLIIFASGGGTNAQAIFDYFRNRSDVNVTAVISNKKDAGVLLRAEKENIPTKIINREIFNSSDFIEWLKTENPTFIILAGFLWKIPAQMVATFPDKIINIHPALLPAYGGKGMYGMHVHEAIVANGDKESGITIHYVNEHYDEGNHITKAFCKVTPIDTAESLADKIHQLEHYYFPITIDFLIKHLPD